MHLSMSLINNKTGELWRQFGPRIQTIPNRVSSDKISLQVYGENHFQRFNPSNTFEKWALVEVTDVATIPDGLESFQLEGGLYAVFDYRGSSADSSIFQYIYSEWLPGSEYQLDHRPHFEVLGDNYRNDDLESEEEIWVPVKRG